MKRTALAVLALVIALPAALAMVGPAAAQDAETVVFRTRAHQAGDLLTVNETMTMEATMKLTLPQMGEQKNDLKNRQKVERDVEILEVAADGTLARIRVEYGESWEEETDQFGAIVRNTRPNENNTYLVTFRDDGVTVTDPDGADVPGDEAMAVEEDFAGGDTDNPMEQEMADLFTKEPVKVGSTIDIDDATAKEMFGDEGGALGDVTFTFTLTGVEKVDGVDHGVFDVVLKATMTPQGTQLDMDLDLKGTAKISTEDVVNVFVMKLEGPIKMDATVDQGNGMQMSIKADGTMKLDYDSRRPKGF